MQQSTVTDPGFLRGGGANPRGGDKNLLFGKNFAENRMKMKEFGPEGGRPWRLLDPPMFRMSMNTAVAKK